MKTTPSGYQRGLVQRAATALALLWALTLSFTSADAAERNLVRRATPIPTPAVGQRIGRVIVSLKPESALFRRQALSASHSAAVVGDEAQRRANALSSSAGVALTAGRFLGERAQVVMAQGVDSVTLAARLARHADVEYAVPDARRRAHLVPNDPLFSAGPASGVGPEVGQWYLRAPDDTIRSAVNAQGAWDIVTGRASVVVAVLDSGVRFDHLDLNNVLLPGYDMITDVAVANDGDGRDADASDAGDWITAAEDKLRNGDFEKCGASASSWHGTLVSGIIGAANNGLGMVGTAFGVRVLPVRVLGKCGGFDSDIIAGIYWAAGVAQPGLPGSSTPARVLNLSLGSDGACDAAYRTAISAVGKAPYSALIVASAGNSDGHAVGSPANCAGVIAVGGLRHAGSKVSYSDLGPEVTISAPAGNCVNTAANAPCLYPILTSTNTGTQRPNAGGSAWTDSRDFSVGTSFSAPIVSGTLALMLSARPTLTPAELIAQLKGTARAFPTGGADNGPDDSTPIAICRAPDAVDQSQCYCTTAVCGAGMLDAAAAVLAARDNVLPTEGARQLMDFGEQTYRQYFPTHPATLVSAPFVYRYYPATGAYLGVVVQSDSSYVLNGVYVLGGPFGGTPQYVGRVNEFIAVKAVAN